MCDHMIMNSPFDTLTIKENDEWELEYWSNQFKCDEEELRAAMNEVGNSVQAIRYYLRSVQAD